MATLSLTRLAVAAGSLALSLSAGAGLAAANPDVDAIVNTTCNYSQVDRALHAEHPAAAAEFDANPSVKTQLRYFLNSNPSNRMQLAKLIEGSSEAQPYIPTIVAVAYSCNNY